MINNSNRLSFIKALSFLFLCFGIISFFVSIAYGDKDESFKEFIKNFFMNSDFQKSRVVLPLKDRQYYIDGKTNKRVFQDKIISDWEFLPYGEGEPGARHHIYDGFIKQEKIDSDTSDEKIIDFYKEDTCLNLMAFFKRIKGKWFLVRLERFVM